MSQCSSEAGSRAVISQRLVYVDSYTTFPIPEVDPLYSQFRGTEIRRVPVIRIFGATTSGQRACAHIHGVFPYLYVEHDPSIFNLEQRLAAELDREIGDTLKDFSSKEAEHVYKIVQVAGRSFYGYKSEPGMFLKIYFYSPIALTKAISLLQTGKILGQNFQPYEAHIPYILQFFMDFKLHGMNLIHFAKIKFRGKIEYSGKKDEALQEGMWDLSEVPHEFFLPLKVTKKTRCELEFDVMASDIIVSKSRTGKNPGIEAIWLDEKERRRKHGVPDWSEITIPVSQDRPSDSFVFKREEELLSTLKSTLSSYLELPGRKGASNSPTRTRVDSPYSPSLTLTPSSQVLIDDIEAINCASQGSVNSNEMEWDKEDQDMVLLLDELAKNRENEDSIISSQVLEDFENDPSFGNENGIVDSTGFPDEDWEQDFLSSSICEFLDEVESKATTQSSKSEAEVNSAEKTMIPGQFDGQEDSSGDDDDESPLVPPKCTNQRHRSRRLPATPQKRVTLVRNLSSNSLSNSPTRSRIRPPTPPSPKIMEGSSSDEDLVPRNPDSVTSEKRPTVSVMTVVSPNRSKIRPPTPPSPPIVEFSSTDHDSDDTQFVPSEPEDASFRPSVSSKSEEFPVKDVECESEIPSVSPELPDSGIRSFYQYPGEEGFSQLNEDFSDEEKSEVTVAPPSQSESIQSFYGYSDEELNHDSSAEMDVSFQDVLMSDHNSQTSSNDTFESTDEEAKSDFARQVERSRLKIKLERESHLALEGSLCPSVFAYEVTPLKNVPPLGELEKWKDTKLCSRKRGRGEDVPKVDEEPLSLRYFQTKVGSHCSHSERNCESREKMIADILKMKAEIMKRKILAVPATPKMPLAENMAQNITPVNAAIASNELNDSDSDDEPVPSKPFRFGGSYSDGEDESSVSGLSDSDTVVEENSSPAPPQTLPSSLRPETPKSAGWISRKRRRLNWDSSQGIRLSLDESELDSVSFRSNQSPLNGKMNSSNYQDVKALEECQFLTTLSMEVHCSARGSLIPNPTEDPICAIFYCYHRDTVEKKMGIQYGNFVCLMVDVRGSSIPECENGPSKCFPDERSMLDYFVNVLHQLDPDFLVGYEICRFSWGYLIDRGRVLGLDLMSEFSRLLPLPKPFGGKERDPRNQEQWNESITGRIVLNLWRLLRHEMTVTSYTLENAVFQILHERLHLLSYRTLTDQWEILNQKFKVIQYFKKRVVDVIRIIEKLDLINRTSELARLFGIQFFEVLSRGSQFRVESMMLRLAKSENFIPPSPSPEQRFLMKAPEYLPLIMEPESMFYSDPVAVLDFQSLYPSMMMAYNYCFSTCLGRIQNLGQEGSFEFGCLSQEIRPEELSSLFVQGLIHISPCGVVFVKESVRKGILGEMLEQILETRQMVKRSMKKWKGDDTLQKVLDSRQLGLKLIANVTYGYTSANFSGRMPCVEIADSVVSKGRETLQRAIDFVKEHETVFGAKVVYGDTDSLFLHFPQKTRAEAFNLAQRIVEEVTSLNPKPVKLKLEKVYQPCILQTKKRYVGYAYETPDQVEPKYDAKGIETVRRDGCPATAKILEGALKVLFETQEEAKVKAYVQEQFRKIFMGRVSLSKYCFAREFRGRDGYKPTAVVPSLEIAKRMAEKDPRAEPLRSQRVPYIVVYGDPKSPLISLIRRPSEFIGNPNLRLNAHYYVQKAIIPPLSRCLSLAKMDVDKWYAEMPRKYLKSHYNENGVKRGTIDQYFVSETCIKCESRSATGFCEDCFSNAGQVQEFLKEEEKRLIQKFQSCCKICMECSGEEEMNCLNMDCPVKHRFLRYDRDYRTRLPKLESLSQKLSTAMSLSW